jgi:TRAP-type uncharacterized transport system fused permease subunit
MQAWKYTLPAFLVPFCFVLDPSGVGLLLKGNWLDVAHVTITAAIGIAALACGVQGWMFTRASRLERLLFIVAGLLLVYPTRAADIAGVVLVLVAAALQWRKRRALRHAPARA